MKTSIQGIIAIAILSFTLPLVAHANADFEALADKTPIKQTPKKKPAQPAKPIVPVETCSGRIGQLLCQGLSDLDSAYGWTCRGNACDVIWSNRIQQIRDFIDTYDQVVRALPSQTRLSVEIGRQAYLIVSTICGNTATGDPGEMAKLAYHENLVLPRLERIQNRAQLSFVVTCEISVH